jgi:hypothetical protein
MTIWVLFFWIGGLPYNALGLLFFVFPIGLGAVYAWIAVWIFWHTVGFSDEGQMIRTENTAELVTFPLAYITYIIHWFLTWNAQKQRIFNLLMLCLVFLISANLVGCAKLDHARLPFQN